MIEPTPLPGQAVEAEVATLGAILFGTDAIEMARGLGLEPEHFASERHRAIYRAAVAVHERGDDATDFGAVADELHRAGELDDAGGKRYLAELIDLAPTSVVDGKVRTVMLAARRRALSRTLATASEEALTADSPADVAARLGTELQDVIRSADTASRKLYSVDELRALPPVEPLLGKILQTDSLVVPYGPPEAFKTFLVLDWGACIATGVRWLHDHAVHKPGPVVFVSGEGRAGLGARVDAWLEERGWKGPLPMYFRLEVVNLMDAADVGRFLAELDALDEPPRLIVFDTLARCMVGGDENSAADMGFAITQADRIRKATGATVALIHHSNKTGEYERGSSALRGAADTMMKVKAEDGLITVICEKQKDGRPFDTIRLRARRVADSMVLEGASGPLHLTASELTPSQRQLLDELHRFAPTEGLTSSKLEDLTELPTRTYYAAKKALLAGEYVAADREGRGARHTLTDKGLRALGAKVQEGATEGADTPGGYCMQAGGPIERPPVAVTDDCACMNPDCNNTVGRDNIPCGSCRADGWSEVAA